MIVFNTFVSASDMVVLLLCRKLHRFPQGYVLDELRQQPDNSTIPNLFPTQQRRTICPAARNAWRCDAS